MIPIKVPPLGESIVEATIARWLKQEGESVAQGETLVELETDKINVEVPAFKAGVLSRVLKKEGDVVSVDETLGELAEAAVAAPAAAVGTHAGMDDGAAGQIEKAAERPTRAGVGVGASEEGTAAQRRGAATAGNGQDVSGAPVAAAVEEEPAAGTVKTSPAVRRIAAEEGIDLAEVAGTGRGGRVTKADMVNHLEQARARGGSGTAQAPTATPERPTAPSADTPPRAPAAAARPAASTSIRPPSDGARETREKMSTRRKRIAQHLLEAQHATAHLTTFNEVDMSQVLALRERVKERVEREHGVKLTFMPFFMKAACMALKAYPVINAQVDGDSIIYKHYINMGIAVAADEGLLVPVIKDADRKGMVELSADISAVAKRARDGKLTMDDLTGGTFTITNGGVFGSLVSTPILNYPQVGILGLHRIQERPVAIDGKVEIRPMMYLALSYDHRIVEGQQAVQFLVRVKELMEDPAVMLVE